MDQFAITYALTIFYLLTDEKYVPEIDLNNPDGRCGVGTYVSLFQKWTFIGLVAAIIPIVLWLREITVSPAWFEKAYLEGCDKDLSSQVGSEKSLDKAIPFNGWSFNFLYIG